jgi:mono/diheme cytochrome c family protein
MRRSLGIAFWAALGAPIAALAIVMAARPAPAPSLDQNWTTAQRQTWYEATQGSRLIPLAWLQALEQPGGSGALVLSDAFIARYGYLPYTTSTGQHLPVGFAIDVTDEAQLSTTKMHWKAGQGASEPWVGFNCAACHTAQITYKGATLRVDGGPTLADFQSFFEALDQALVETLQQPAKFQRFATRVLGAQDTAANQTMLKTALAQLVAQRERIDALNASPLRYGPGRLDAVGRIFNQLAVDVNASQPTANPPQAPVSYPFLWNIPQHQRVEWDGLTPNLTITSPVGDSFDAGALARNTGEVIGVFGDLTIVSNPGATGYRSSVNIANLAALEQLLRKLRPPRWPSEVFGAPDPALVKNGAVLFAARCASCHQPLARTDLSTPIQLRMSMFRGGNAFSPPGTDIWMACNAYAAQMKSGAMQGTPSNYISGAPFGAQDHATNLLEAAVKGALAGKKWDVAQVATQTFFGVERPAVVAQVTPRLPPGAHAIILTLTPQQARAAACLQDVSNVLGYKIRPLTGIWATAPFLHNGSAPTLYDLLLPPAQRPQSFYVGSREYDPVKVGYRSDAASGGFLFNTRDSKGLPIPGNSNAGHDYGNASLSDADRMALIAYLKTL